MTEFQDILYEKHHRVRGAAWLTINRPDLMNSFTGRTLDEMRAAVQDAAGDNQVGVLVITGAGDRAFCAGGDVRWLQEVQREGKQVPMDPHAGIEDFLKPVIARVNGLRDRWRQPPGLLLRLHDRLRTAPLFAQVGPRVGSPASGHWVSYLTHVVGAKKAKEIWMLTRRYSAQEALEMGLVNAVVPHEELDAEVDRWCAELMQKSPSCLRILKASFREVFQPLRQPRRDWVGEFAPDFYQTGEADEGKNAFLERRDSDFSRFPR